MLNLTYGQAFNGFDVRLNYTNPASVVLNGVLQAEDVSDSGNILGSYNRGSPDAKCIDGQGLLSNGAGCAPDDYPGPGQIHFAEGVAGASIQGPLSAALLMSITFTVRGQGVSLVYFDRWNLINPNPQPPGSQNFNPVYVPLVAYAAVFGNKGLVAFFNASPYDPTVSVSIIVGPFPHGAMFDATGSVDTVNTSLAPTNYSWDFGDRILENSTGPLKTHAYVVPGNYSVRLTVTDSAGRVGSITRVVSVVPSLGGLALTVKDQIGTVMRGNVLVQVFNSSTAQRPFASKTIDQFGQVQFDRLLPGTYTVTLSGQIFSKTSRSETVGPGWTTQDTFYLNIPGPPPDYSWLVFIVPMAAGVGIIGIFGIIRRRDTARNRRSAKMAGKASRKRRGSR